MGCWFAPTSHCQIMQGEMKKVLPNGEMAEKSPRSHRFLLWSRPPKSGKVQPVLDRSHIRLYGNCGGEGRRKSCSKEQSS